MPRTGQKGDMAAISPARPPRPPEAKFKRLHARDRAVTLQQKESRLPVRAGASMPQVTCTKVVQLYNKSALPALPCGLLYDAAGYMY